MKLKKIIKVTLIAIAGILGLAATLCLVIPFVLLANADKVTAAKLDNTYIDAEYKNWHEVTIPEVGTFKLPENWALENQNGTYHVVDAEGNDIALGFESGTSASLYHSDEEFLGSIYDSEDVSVQWENTGILYIDLSNFRAMELNCGDNSYKFHVLSLRESATTELNLFFSADSGMSYDDLYEIAEAVIYSFEF